MGRAEVHPDRDPRTPDRSMISGKLLSEGWALAESVEGTLHRRPLSRDLRDELAPGLSGQVAQRSGIIVTLFPVLKQSYRGFERIVCHLIGLEALKAGIQASLWGAEFALSQITGPANTFC